MRLRARSRDEGDVARDLCANRRAIARDGARRRRRMRRGSNRAPSTDAIRGCRFSLKKGRFSLKKVNFRREKTVDVDQGKPCSSTFVDSTRRRRRVKSIFVEKTSIFVEKHVNHRRFFPTSRLRAPSTASVVGRWSTTPVDDHRRFPTSVVDDDREFANFDDRKRLKTTKSERPQKRSMDDGRRVTIEATRRRLSRARSRRLSPPRTIIEETRER